MKVLLIKTSSLGDIIHTFPALTDAQRAVPDIKFDWVIEERFKNIASWHPAVNKAIPVAIRRWRGALLKKTTWSEFQNFAKEVKATDYDLVIDAQGLMKSVWISWLVKAKSSGYSFGCARDRIAPIFYSQRLSVTWGHHAVERIRHLFSGALGYALPQSIADYGLEKKRWKNDEESYVLFFHGTTWANKHWPKTYWITLAKMLNEEGIPVKFSWGSKQELANSEEMAKHCKKAEVLPDLDVEGLLPVIASASAVVAVDTGLCHLSAALGVPTIALFGPTDPKKTGAVGASQVNLQANFPCAPCLNRDCSFQGKSEEWPACFSTLPPSKIFDVVISQINSSRKIR